MTTIAKPINVARASETFPSMVKAVAHTMAAAGF